MTVVQTQSIDVIIDKALTLCKELPKLPDYVLLTRNINNLRERLAGGKLHIAVLGQFNRGKSSFINALLGINVLPISVLPITSVPTVISYGKTNHCRISFSDEKEDETVEGNIESISSLLETYATEKNNPENQLCVSDIIVKCESTLLEHGTVIIDTPGFGSTHTHNTQTTLDFLSTCDAALFLLSADLPITQVEVDFLKNVIETVPRIFFIYNKIDLLNNDELAASEIFIKDTLSKTFNFPVGVNLFPVTAKKMGESKKDNELFVKSGFAKIEKEIIEFLLREKYFTLSEALTGKFKDALENILSSLNAKKEEILNPIYEIKEEVDQAEELLNNIQKDLNERLTLLNSEQVKLNNYCQNAFNSNINHIYKNLDDHLHKLLYTNLKGSPDALIPIALSQMFEETFKGTCLSILTELNKPLRKITDTHRRELRELINKVSGFLEQKENDKNDFPEISYDPIEIDTTTIWKPQKAYDISPPKSSPFERFTKTSKRYNTLQEYYSTLLTNNIDSCQKELSDYINNLISIVFNDFIEDIKKDYNITSKIVNNFYEYQISLLNNSKEKVEPDLSKQDYLIDGFAAVKNMLV